MTLKRGAMYGLCVVFAVWGWFSLRGCNKRTDQAVNNSTLKPEEKASVIVDPRHHTITTITRSSSGTTNTKATFLPDSGARVSIGNHGEVLVTNRSWGTEINPFMGAAFGSDIRLRAALGLDLFYIQRWELGTGMLVGNVHDIRLFAHVSYNFYDDWYVAMGIDNKSTAHVMAGLKF